MAERLLIREATNGDREYLNAFVAADQKATLFHDPRWLDAVEKTYGYQCRSMIAERGGAIVGYLPLTLVSAPLLGRSLISTAFSVGGGVLGGDTIICAALADAAVEIGRRENVRYVEFRGGDAPIDGWSKKEGVYASFSKDLPADIGALKSWLPRNRRAEVKKALRIEASAEYLFSPQGDVDGFYAVFSGAVKRLGTPVMPRKFLYALKELFGEDAEISLVLRDGAPVAGLFSFWRGDRVLPYFIGGTKEAREIRAYDYLYFKLMQRAIERGVRRFDFGRSKVGSSHFNTKKYWGFEPAPLTYHVRLVSGRELPNLNPNNPKFSMVSRLWTFLPTPIANIAGPVLARNFA